MKSLNIVAAGSIQYVPTQQVWNGTSWVNIESSLTVDSIESACETNPTLDKAWEQFKMLYYLTLEE